MTTLAPHNINTTNEVPTQKRTTRMNNYDRMMKDYESLQEIQKQVIEADNQLRKNLDNSREVMINIFFKYYLRYSRMTSQLETLPPSLQWAYALNHKNAKIVYRNGSFYVDVPDPSKSVHETKSYVIKKIFVTGSMWDVAAFTRRTLESQKSNQVNEALESLMKQSDEIDVKVSDLVHQQEKIKQISQARSNRQMKKKSK